MSPASRAEKSPERYSGLTRQQECLLRSECPIPYRCTLHTSSSCQLLFSHLELMTIQWQRRTDVIKQLRKVGNSNALLLDKPLLELVGLEENATVEITIDHGNIIISPVSPGIITDARTEELLNKIVRTRRSVLEKLA